MMQPTQYQIEQSAGITQEVAQHMMKGETEATKRAMELLGMCVCFYEPCAFTLLRQSVLDCKAEMNKEPSHG